MNLRGLRCLLSDSDACCGLVDSGGKRIVLPDAARAAVLASLYHGLKTPLLIITSHMQSAKKLVEELSFWCDPGASIHLFPEIHVLPYERLAPDLSIVQRRMAVLSALRDSPKERSMLVVASGRAVSQKTVSPDVLTQESVKVGQRIDIGRLMTRFAGLGYETTEIVESPGQVAKRGGIIDIFSPNSSQPSRIEFFGHEVESIRFFDPLTQRSMEGADSVSVALAREMILPHAEILQQTIDRLDLSGLGDDFLDSIREDLTLLSGGQWRDGLEFYAPLFNNASLLDHFPAEAPVVLDDPENIATGLAELEAQSGELRQNLIERGQLLRNFPPPYFEWSHLLDVMEGTGKVLRIGKWGAEGDFKPFDFGPPPSYSGQLGQFIEDAASVFKERARLVVVSRQANRIAELLGQDDILVSPLDELSQAPPVSSISLLKGSLSGGWVLGDTTLLTDAEIFGFIKERRPQPVQKTSPDVFIADLNVGDFVVHIDHGIARFDGVIKMESEGVERDYLVLDYADSDKLYVPADQVDRVARYIGPGGYAPSLSRLNTQEWARTKQRVKKAASDLASELLQIYAARETVEGHAFGEDTLWQQELEASFPYVETPDQIQAIGSIKNDMESPRPMDRLVCGDVGYGKTEVALRAAFKAVMDNRQVAILVPTTVLAQQHLNTFSERLAAFPVKIDMLSRFRSPKEQHQILQNLAAGAVDICIGTHRLLQSDVVFSDLGLVIIDEEQKFGVAHKEKLKQLRSEVDVLTLSATPIPRTLHMSLVGVRDMSVMETPPEERLPIRTYVAEYDDQTVREAILRELDRNGQIYFLHNRVQSIGFIADHLRRLVPEAVFVVGHGQMNEDQLELAMMRFASGEADVLVCTTIIESGLDLPNANTLIVNNSDKLGLTQLYHLRGRVGRGDVRAYAYFFYEKGKRLTDPAEKRLRTIFEATELGAGFQIAMKDLEIRGAGNILGAQQSGSVGAVGFDLYCRLLSKSVETLKSGEVKAEASEEIYPNLDLPMTAFIPEKYVPDLNVRLALYQRLARIDSLQMIKEMRQEFEDRFGKLPQPVQNLFSGIRIKLLALQAGISKIATEEGDVVIFIAAGIQMDRASLQRKFGSSVKVGPTVIRLNVKKLGKFWPRLLEQVLVALSQAKKGAAK